MKRLIAFIFLFTTASGVYGQSSPYRAGETVRITGSDTLNGNVWVAGSLVEILGVLNNDLFSAGEQVYLDGSIGDDAFVAGSNVSFRGTIGDMLLVAGETVIIDGTVSGDLIAFSSNIHITNEGHVEGNALIFGAEVSLDGGRVDGWLRTGGEEVRLNGMIGQYTEIWSENVTFGSDYTAAYSTTVNSESRLYQENMGLVPEDLVINVKERPFWRILVQKLVVFLSVLITGVTLLFFFPGYAGDMQKFACESYWKNTGIGLLSLIFIPVLIIVLFALILTIPLGILTGALFLLILFLSYLIVSLVLGNLILEIFRESPNRYWALFTGMLLIMILINLPWLGGILNFLLILFGTGSIVYYLIRLRSSKTQSEALS